VGSRGEGLRRVTMTSEFVDTIDWSDLEHAYGSASDIPPLLKQISIAKGRKLLDPINELYSRVLHQGTIYSASPPAAHALIEMLSTAAPPEKAIFYELLTGFCEAARLAFADGRAIPCHAGGDPVDGREIEREIRGAFATFVVDLPHAEPAIRNNAVSVLTAFPDADPAIAHVVRQRWSAESDATVRAAIVTGLDRLRDAFSDWPEFLTTALSSERDSYNRFLLRRAQLMALKGSADSTVINDLVINFVKARGSGDCPLADDSGLFDALETLDRDRNIAGLLAAFDLATDHDQLRILAARLLRLVFDDQRTNWGGTAISSLNADGSPPPSRDPTRATIRMILRMILWKIFPLARRWRMRRMARSKPKQMLKVDYWGLNGPAPELPAQLTETQRRVLVAFTEKAELWQFRTNLWELFGLPVNAEALAQFAK
jgi:hypothetical protein